VESDGAGINGKSSLAFSPMPHCAALNTHARIRCAALNTHARIRCDFQNDSRKNVGAFIERKAVKEWQPAFQLAREMPELLSLRLNSKMASHAN